MSEGGSDVGSDGARGSQQPERQQFNQGERYSAETAPPRVSMWRLLAAGGGMIGATLLLGLIGAPGWLAFIAGVAVFAGVIFQTSPARRAAAEARAEAEQAEQAIQARRAAIPSAVREALIDANENLAAIDAVAARLAQADDAVHTTEQTVPTVALSEFTAAARAVAAGIETDPQDYDRARKFFRVVIPSARAAAEKYEALPARDADLAARFGALAADLAAAARKQRENLLADELIDLEVEMEVLAERVRGAAEAERRDG